ncbi:FAD-dependent oxidoreductase [Eggerthella guodeyinii]|uniref:FAD-dependent oxidoreductase n=1 Tax=Eggerthella guodeyinii TaxID=2690837 RepID=A0A6N7RJV5_9ACTN|nr:FAD-dependent oxidoreductase [Eggerthella guodeyinii]MRX81217.1 FAD-dependent oxidoreductase [Eggerthella guodeyinii]
MDITRRSFIGAATAAGLGSIVALGGLTGCSPQNGKATPEENDESTIDRNDAPALNPQDTSYASHSGDCAALFEPLQMGSITLRNRIVKSPAGSDTWAPEGDALNDNFLDYYENFAKGGASLVFVESSISKMMAVKPLEQVATGWLLDDMSAIPQLMAPVTERIHRHDAYAGFQIGMGMLAEDTTVINDMTPENLAWLQGLIVELATQLKAAGFDVVELHCAATQILKYMTVSRTNARTDQYGADTLENRTRFICETIKGIKEACGQEYPVQILMDAVEENDADLGDNDGFLTLEESIADARAFEAAGADTFYLRLSVPGRHIAQFAPDLMFSGYQCEGMTGFGTRADFSQHFGGTVNGQYSGCAMLLKAAAAFKKNLKATVSCAGYMDPRTAPDLMNDAVARGEIDYLMITRPLTVDPELPNKLKEGRRDEIAPCCRCMHCHAKGGPAQYASDGKEYCRVNAVTQRAYTEEMPEGYALPSAEQPKRIMVVGGGPAGMEAARIAAQRGHAVSLYEKKNSLGGLMSTAHVFKGDHERLGDLIDYLARQQEVSGVEVITGTEVDAETVKQVNPDAVVVAVGGARESRLEATDDVNVVSVDDLVGAETGENVVICGAGAQAIDCALFLLAQGKKVQMVHEGEKEIIDKEQSMWVRAFVIPHLYGQGVKIWNNAKIGSVVNEGLSITTASGEEKTLACQTVLECYDMVPNRKLADELSTSFETIAVGDCDSPFDIAQAIKAGNLAARSL